MTATHQHHYRVGTVWTGNRGSGTQTYQGYERSHDIHVVGKPILAGSSDRAFRGESSRHNPEDLLVAALSTCHMLSYLHVATLDGVIVTAYVDAAEGVMETVGQGGRFVSVVLRPTVTIDAASDPARAMAAHAQAHQVCFIANSVNFPVSCEPRIVVESG